jgi:surface polysaccharide O-acyltransferase-like enzyme
VKQRRSNLELLRIISMSGIVVMHYYGMGGAVQNGDFPHFSWFLVHFLNSFSIPLVNCFVLITGYFLVTKTAFSLRKPVELLILTAFYGGLSWLIALLCGQDVMSVRGIAEALFPFIRGSRWFVETYIILILFSPFLNVLLLRLRKEHYRVLLAIQLGLFCLWYSVGFSAPVLDDGYGILNFITLYLLGGYIRLHGSDFERLSRRLCFAVYAGCALATFVLSYFINPFGYAFVTNVVGSTAIFLGFLKWELGVRPAVNRISASAFDLYFVHSDFNTSRLLFSGLLGARFVADTVWMIPHLLLVIPVVWVMGYAAYLLRIRLFARTVDRLLDRSALLNESIRIASESN